MAMTRRFLALLGFLLVACSDDPTGPEVEPTRTLTLFASDSAFVQLSGDSAVVVPVSAAWEIGFWRTSVFLRAGSPAVAAACLCQNDGSTDAQIMAMSPSSELADFESVTAAQVPAGASAWSATQFTERPWYRYNITGTDNQIWPLYHVYLVRIGDEVYKLQLTGYYDAAGAPRYITFRYARLAD
jgi:hypothetical protein